jgi:mannose/fructose/N-acetylgalactosamine-specific phosphotransferase system component IIC
MDARERERERTKAIVSSFNASTSASASASASAIAVPVPVAVTAIDVVVGRTRQNVAALRYISSCCKSRMRQNCRLELLLAFFQGAAAAEAAAEAAAAAAGRATLIFRESVPWCGLAIANSNKPNQSSFVPVKLSSAFEAG